MRTLRTSHSLRWFIPAVSLFLSPFLMSGAAFAGPDREEAIQLVLDTFVHGTPEESTSVVFLYHRDLPDSILDPGTIINDHEGTVERIIEAPSFFFFIDQETQYMWSHRTTFVIMDAETGAMDSVPAETWPLLNGLSEPRFLPMGNASPDLVFGQYPERDVPIEYTPVSTGTTGSWALIAVGFPEQSGDSELFESEAERAVRILNGIAAGPRVSAEHITKVGVTAMGNAIGATPDELCTAIENLPANCDKLYFTYVGHGLKNLGMILRGGELTWLELAKKLIATGAKEICVTVIACHSGAAIPAFGKAEVKINGKTRKFKGSIVTSSGARRKTHVTGESPFGDALEACYQDPLANLNGDTKVSDIEATAWAAFLNATVAGDQPQGKVIGDKGSTTLKPPVVKDTKSRADEGGELKYEKVKFEFAVKDSAGKDTLMCRQRLYIRNESGADHKGKRSVTIWCVDNSSKPAKRDSVASFVPAAKDGQLVCVARLPDNCKAIEVKKGAKAKARGLSPLSFPGPVEIISDMTNTIDAGAAYAKGEFLFFDLLVPGVPGESFVTSLDDVPGWSTAIAPAFFTVPVLLDTQTVVLQGVVPDTATAGAWLHALIVNTTTSDTTIYRVHALLYDSLAVPIAGGDLFQHRYLDVPLGLNVTAGIARIEDSTVRPTGITSCNVEPAGDLKLLRSVIQPDSGGTSGFTVRGRIDAEYATWNELLGGLRLEAAAGSLFNGAVLNSDGDGITMTGSQALMAVDFLTVEGSLGHGVVLDNAINCLLGNVTIEDSGNQDVEMRNGSQAELRDCSYDRAKESVDPGSTLQRTWSTAFAITTFEGDSVAFADVEVVNAQGQTVYHQTVNVDGFTNLIPLREYVRTGNTTIAHTPHTVRVNAFGVDRFFTYDSDAARIMTLVVTDSTSAGSGGENIPTQFLLTQNTPNPFHSETVIRFDLPEPSEVRLRVFDVRGAQVAVLAEGRYPAGIHELPWRPAGLAPGIYFYVLDAGSVRQARRLVVR